jgi:4-hydroxy-2-oxoheptanedioate aldolase
MSDMITNRFKARLHAGELMWGMWFGLANNIAAEICAQSGFDWLLIDSEHSPLTDKDILSCLQAVAPYDINPIVRPVRGDAAELKRLTDIGAQTFLVPMVNSAEQAADIVSAVKYPPEGSRGLGTSMARAARWNMAPNYFKRANDEMCVICQIETVEGLSNLKEITAVDGVDAIFIGPSDLGAALGYPGQPMHEDVVKAVSQALSDVTDAGKPSGVLVVDPEVAKQYIGCGASFVGVGSDCGILASGAAKLAQSFKSGGSAKGDY